MIENHIAVIVEGAKREIDYFKKINAIFFPSSSIDILALPFGQNIYELWKILKKDDFLTDIIEVVRERSPENRKQLERFTADDFPEIYLFFDLDPQQKTLPPGQNWLEVVAQMLEVFDNETEKGKLYLSYPMVEALRDIKAMGQCKAFWQCAVSVPSLKARKDLYKQMTGDAPMADFTKYTREKWEAFNASFLRRCACLFQYSNGQIPSEDKELYQWYKTKEITPAEIFETELCLLHKENHIFVLSAFPEFLLDYFKPAYWSDFPQISRGEHFGDSCTGLNSILPT